ncbi:hypothetical protein NY547_04835 [Cnuibacter physcomitrellae]|uniref:hypothetical protein n=1 Tax=Cnuibacter physcomitrellae TaxID=1619308 RepID=UPI0021760863|nr:hypothetical protein [Cnuibacter physcomitrellae]MCS5496564.1 hypothetical protein [Cnuibacter physcomitrellae]
MAGLDGAITISIPTLIGVASGLVIVAVIGLVTARAVRTSRRRRAQLHAEQGYQVGVAAVRGPGRRRSSEGAARTRTAGPTGPAHTATTPDTASQPLQDPVAVAEPAWPLGPEPVLSLPPFPAAPAGESSRWPLAPEPDAAAEDPAAGHPAAGRPTSDRDPTPSAAAVRLFGRPGRAVGLDASRAVFLLALLVPALVPSSSTLVVTGITAADWCSRIGLSGVLLVSAAASVVALREGDGSPTELSRRRLRRLTRSLLLLPLAAALLALDAPGGVEVLLAAVLSPLAILLAPLRSRLLVPLGFMVLLLAPAISAVTAFVLPRAGDASSALRAVGAVTGWSASQGASLAMAVVAAFVGAALAGAITGGPARRALVALAGAALAVGGFAALLMLPGLGSVPSWAVTPVAAPDRSSVAVLATSLGIAVVVTALLLLAQNRLRTVLLPLSAVGSLALSATVVGGVIVLARVPAIVDEALPPLAWLPLAITALSTAVLCVLWRTALGDGPLERLVGAVLARMAPAAKSAEGEAEAEEGARRVRQAAVPPSRADVTVRATSERTRPGAPTSTHAPTPASTAPTPRPSDPRPVSHWTPGQALGRLPY